MNLTSDTVTSFFRRGLAAVAAPGLLGFAVYKMHDAALAYLGVI
jgi:hypothetical protein